MHRILGKLHGGDRGSIGRSDQVGLEISGNPDLFSQIFEGLLGPDPVVRMRAADAIEKSTRKHAELLQPYKGKILRPVALIDQQEVRWHVAQILPRLRLTHKERDVAVSILLTYLESKSSIVKTFTMQALADLASQSPRLRPRVVRLLESFTDVGTPAM